MQWVEPGRVEEVLMEVVAGSLLFLYLFFYGGKNSRKRPSFGEMFGGYKKHLGWNLG